MNDAQWIEDRIAAGTLTPGARGMAAADAASQHNDANALSAGDPGYLVPPSASAPLRGVRITDTRSTYADMPTREHHLSPADRAALTEAQQWDLIELDEAGHPIIADFLDKFCGTYDSFRDYATEYAESIGLLDGVSAEVKRYFSWHGYARDLAIGHTVLGAPDYRVYIFRDY